MRKRDEQARLRQIAEDAIPKGLAVGMEFVRAEAARERDEAVAALARAVEHLECDEDRWSGTLPELRRVLSASIGEAK